MVKRTNLFIIFICSFLLTNIQYLFSMADDLKEQDVQNLVEHFPYAPLVAPGQKITVPLIKWSGYINVQAPYDSRQVVAFRDQHFLLWPREYLPDVKCRDINAHGQFNLHPFQSRLRLTTLGPDIFNRRVWGLIEGDFHGVNDSVANSFRLRHAFINFEWDHQKLLIGQYWHVLSQDDAMANTVDFNGGAPMAVQIRVPQIRYTNRWADNELVFAANMQRDGPSNGPVGPDTIYARNAIIPSLTLQYRHYWDKSFVGIIGNYKRLVPRLVSDTCYKVNESINSAIAMFHVKYVENTFVMNMNFAYIENGNNPYFFGGYAVRTQDPITNFRTYESIRDLSWWLDLDYKYCWFEPGLFMGVIRNIGARNPLFINPNTGRPIVYAFVTGNDNSDRVDYVWRIAPRVWFVFKPLSIAAELEFTTAAYGCLNVFGKPVCSKPVTDVRLLVSMFYYF